MALIECAECGRQVSPKAPTCPNCGSPVASPVPQVQVVPAPAKRSGCATLVAAAFLIFCLLVLLSQCSPSPTDTGNSPTKAASLTPAPKLTSTETWTDILKNWDPDASPSQQHVRLREEILSFKSKYPNAAETSQADDLLPRVESKANEFAALEARATSERKWQYSVDTDAMTGKQAFHAFLASENTVELDFPYGEPQHGRLAIRQSPQFGFDVFFYIERGQLLCNSWEGCSALVRIDDSSPRKWKANGAADHSTETIFFSNDRALYEAIKEAKVIRIQPEIYQAGLQTFEFDVSGFDPDRFQPPKKQ